MDRETVEHFNKEVQLDKLTNNPDCFAKESLTTVHERVIDTEKLTTERLQNCLPPQTVGKIEIHMSYDEKKIVETQGWYGIVSHTTIASSRVYVDDDLSETKIIILYLSEK